MTDIVKGEALRKGFGWSRQTGTVPMDVLDAFPLYPTGAGAALSASTFYGGLYYAGRGGLIDRIMINNSVSGGAGKKMRLGIYSCVSEFNLYPGALLLDSGELAADVVALMSAIVAYAIPPDRPHWRFVLSDGTPAVHAGIPYTPCFLNSQLTAPIIRLVVAQAYGALPAVFPAGAAISGTNPPLIGVRHA